MSLAPERLARFARHIVLPELGGAGQVALAGKHVVLLGLGGIGSPALQYLAAAGIGRLTLVDDDRVDVSNLQRQTLYSERDVGHGKSVAAKRWVTAFDPALEVEISDRRVISGNARALVAGADAVLDGTDNFATRLAVSDACVAEGVPLIAAAVGRFQGQVGAFAGHREGEPCYRCFVGDAFDAEACDSCAEDGMVGAMAGWVATFAALHTLKVLLEGVAGLGAVHWGQVFQLDGLAPSLRPFRIVKDPGCAGCGG